MMGQIITKRHIFFITIFVEMEKLSDNDSYLTLICHQHLFQGNNN